MSLVVENSARGFTVDSVWIQCRFLTEDSQLWQCYLNWPKILVNSSSSAGEICVSLRQSGLCAHCAWKATGRVVESPCGIAFLNRVVESRCWTELGWTSRCCTWAVESNFRSNQKLIIKHLWVAMLPVKCHKKCWHMLGSRLSAITSCGTDGFTDGSSDGLRPQLVLTHTVGPGAVCVNLLINRYTAVMLVNKRWGTSGLLSLSLLKLVVHWLTKPFHSSDWILFNKTFYSPKLLSAILFTVPNKFGWRFWQFYSQHFGSAEEVGRNFRI